MPRKKQLKEAVPFPEEFLQTSDLRARKLFELARLNEFCIQEIKEFNEGKLESVSKTSVLARDGKLVQWTANQKDEVKKLWNDYFEEIEKQINPEPKATLEEKKCELEETIKNLKSLTLEQQIRLDKKDRTIEQKDLEIDQLKQRIKRLEATREAYRNAPKGNIFELVSKEKDDGEA